MSTRSSVGAPLRVPEGRKATLASVTTATALALMLALPSTSAWAQAAASPAASSTPVAAGSTADEPPTHPGRQVLADKCTLCHGDSMWRDIRQDERAWRSTLYRMVSKGAVWTEGEIGAMSGYLATAFGRDAVRTAANR